MTNQLTVPAPCYHSVTSSVCVQRSMAVPAPYKDAPSVLASSCTTPRRHRATLTQDAPTPTGWQGWYGSPRLRGRKSASPRIFRSGFGLSDFVKLLTASKLRQKHEVQEGFIGRFSSMNFSQTTRPDPSCWFAYRLTRDSAQGGHVRLSGLLFSACSSLLRRVAGRTRLCETPESADWRTFFGCEGFAHAL